MNNLQCAIAVLASHREARGWNDEAVALDLLAQLGVDSDDDAKHAAPALDPSLVTEDQVVAAEAAADVAADKAKAVRGVLDRQLEAQAFADVTAADLAKAQNAAREAGEKAKMAVSMQRSVGTDGHDDKDSHDDKSDHDDKSAGDGHAGRSQSDGRADRPAPAAARAHSGGRSDAGPGRRA